MDDKIKDAADSALNAVPDSVKDAAGLNAAPADAEADTTLNAVPADADGGGCCGGDKAGGDKADGGCCNDKADGSTDTE